MVSLAKITAKSQTTIPREVREALHVGAGDFVVGERSNDGNARMRKAQALDGDYLRALEGTLTEWRSAADEEAYRGLSGMSFNAFEVVRVTFPELPPLRSSA